jgi:hypothetical protein
MIPGDLTDQATFLEEMQREKAYEAVQAALRRDQTMPTGECRNCGQITAPEARFCDADCRDDYEHQAKMRKLSGT